MDVVFFAGILAFLLGNIWLVIIAFREHLLWGLAVWLIPLAGVVFAIRSWEAARPAFLLSLAGVALCAVSIWVGIPNPLGPR